MVAVAEGYGRAASDIIAVRDGLPVRLQLVEDAVIQGQILDLEGLPISGAQLDVAVVSTARAVDEFLGNLRATAKQKPSTGVFSFVPMSDFMNPRVDLVSNEKRKAGELNYPCLTPTGVVTDEQGKFRLSGIGRDRIAALRVSGPNIVTSLISVVTREMDPIGASAFIGGRTRMTYGARFVYSAEPSQPIVGVVTDAQTAKPIPNTLIKTTHYDAAHADAVTDAEGRYRLTGLPKKKAHDLLVVPPATEPYFTRRVSVTPSDSSLAAAKFDIALRRAVWLKGQVTDKSTGQPVTGRVFYLPAASNKLVAQYPTFRRGSLILPQQSPKGVYTDQQGRFEIPAVPGSAVLAVLAAEERYPLGAGFDQLEAHLKDPVRKNTNTYDSIKSDWVHAFRQVEVSDAGGNVDLQLDPGESISLVLQDPQGAPLAGVRIHGRRPSAFRTMEPPTIEASTRILGIDPKTPRVVYFYHPARNLATAMTAQRGSKRAEPLQLLPAGTLRGRLIDNSGKPVPSVVVMIQPTALKTAQPVAIGQTDAEGHFETSRFVPGMEFNLIVQDKQMASVRLDAGEVRDLGELVVQRPTAAVESRSRCRL